MAELIGRASERRALVDAIQHGSLQLVGPGGIGKSALIRDVAPDAIWVTLDAGNTEFNAAVSATLGVPPERWSAAVGDRLVVLDGAENHREAAGRFAMAHPTIVSTRRRVPSVAAIALGPLSVEEGVALFLRLAGMRWTQQASKSERDSVPSLVRSVECWPLAIELAARRLRLFTPSELIENLGILGLSDGQTGRHTSVERALEPSWRSCSERQREALRRLSAFCSSFDTDAVDAVCGPEPVLDELVDRSLVHPVGNGRFRMLAPIRELVIARGGGPSIHHRDWVLSRAIEAVAGVDGVDCADSRRTLRRLAPDLHALRGQGGLTHAQAAHALGVLARTAGEPAAATWLEQVDRTGLPQSWVHRLALEQARAHLRSDQIEAALRSCQEATPTLERAVVEATAVAWTEAPRAIEILRGALQDFGGDSHEAEARHLLALQLLLTGDIRGAREELAVAGRVVRFMDRPDLQARIAVSASRLDYVCLHPLQTVIARFEDALALYRSTENRAGVATALFELSRARIDARHPDATDTLTRAVEAARRVWGDREHRPLLFLQALVRLESDDFSGAASALKRLHRVPAPETDDFGLLAVFPAVALALRQARHDEGVEVLRSGIVVAENARKGHYREAYQLVLWALGRGSEPQSEHASHPSIGRLREAFHGDPEAVANLSALRLVVDAIQRPTVRLGPNGAWFIHRGTEVSLANRGPLRRILAALATQGSMTGAEIQEAGWPGESLVGDSGRRRVKRSLHRLRELGLGTALRTERTDGVTVYHLRAVFSDGR